jgi:hypothetical protein
MVKTLSTYAGLALLLIGVAFFVFSNAYQTEASAFPGTGYNAKQVLLANVGTSSIKSLSGEIGSIVISSTSPVATHGPMIAFYDTASTTIATTSMTAVFSFGANGAVTPPAGTYTFDVAFGKGIYMWVNPSYNGAYTITYR